MCVAVICHRVTEEYPLVIVSNRDESRSRDTRAAEIWDDDSGLVAGRDMDKGGTWLGVTASGRAALVTNFREPGMEPGPRSRGALVADFLRSTVSTGAFLDEVANSEDDYSGYNLIVFDGADLGYASNRGGDNRQLGNRVYGLSNHLLDTPWPKVIRTRGEVERLLRSDELPVEAFFDAMRDSATAPDADLPSTGVLLELERRLSSIFIEGGAYGTRCTTVVAIRNDGHVFFNERSYDESSRVTGQRTIICERGEWRVG